MTKRVIQTVPRNQARSPTRSPMNVRLPFSRGAGEPFTQARDPAGSGLLPKKPGVGYTRNSAGIAKRAPTQEENEKGVLWVYDHLPFSRGAGEPFTQALDPAGSGLLPKKTGVGYTRNSAGIAKRAPTPEEKEKGVLWVYDRLPQHRGGSSVRTEGRDVQCTWCKRMDYM